MTDNARQKTKSKSKQLENELTNLLDKALKVKAGYDYPSASRIIRPSPILHG